MRLSAQEPQTPAPSSSVYHMIMYMVWCHTIHVSTTKMRLLRISGGRSHIACGRVRVIGISSRPADARLQQAPSLQRQQQVHTRMIPDQHPILQALLGTLVTWGLTALGSAMVFVLDVEDKKTSQKILDGMLGFAGGVMLAASYWSLLAPAIEIAEQSELYGEKWAFVPAAVGFALGAATLFGTEQVLPQLEKWFARPQNLSKKFDDVADVRRYEISPQRHSNEPDPMALYGLHSHGGAAADKTNSFRRVLLLVIAITLHNLPEGMAVGVGFGSVGRSKGATFSNAVNLAIGIGLQNFPEGLAVSMPLRREGMSPFRAFMWGQLSGIVEPIGGMIGAGAVMFVEPILPYALSFAAGAMIFVVVDDLIPEATQSGNQKLSTFGVIVGFIVMMTMDVALG